MAKRSGALLNVMTVLAAPVTVAAAPVGAPAGASAVTGSLPPAVTGTLAAGGAAAIGIAGANALQSGSSSTSPEATPTPTPARRLVYHETDLGSANDIVNNGLNVGNWQASRPGGLLSTKGFSVSEDINAATVYAEYNYNVTDCGCDPALLEADFEALQPILRGGDGTSSVDLHEFYIDPDDFNKVGPGVFRFSPQQP